MSDEELSAFRDTCVGKTITAVAVTRADCYDRLELTFTDGTSVQIDSQDYEDYSSWLRLGAGPLADKAQEMAAFQAAARTAQLQRGDVTP